MNGQQPIDLSGGFVPKQPTPPAGGGDIDLSGGFVQKPPPPPDTPPHEDYLDQWLQKHYIIGAPVNLLAGIGAGAEQTVAGVDKMARRAVGNQGEDAVMRAAARPTHGVMQGIGKGAEAVGECAMAPAAAAEVGDMFKADEILGMLGKAGDAMGVTEKLKQAQQISDTIRKVPYLGKAVRIGLNAVKSGAMGGGQEFVKAGGDVGQAVSTGKTQAEITAALETALPPAVRWAAKPLANYLERGGPKAASMVGEESPVLASQMGDTGRLVESADTPAPAMQAKQQAFNAGVVRKYAQKAYQTAVNKLNMATSAAARYSPFNTPMLPAPEATPIEPTTFSLDVPTTERPIGMVQQAQPFPRTATSGVPGMEPAPETTRALGSTAKTIPERAQMRATRPHMPSGAPGEAERVSTAGRPGTATMSTQDPLEAIQWKNHLEQVMSGPEWREMSPTDQEAYVNLHKDLSDQLNMPYPKYPQAPGYQGQVPLIDPTQGSEHLQTPGMVADALQARLRPSYDALNDATDGEFERLKNTVNDAKADMSNTRLDDEAHKAAEDRFNKANGDIDKLLESTPISRPYYDAMKSVTPDVKFLQALDAFQERAHNGVTVANTTKGLPRMMRGNLRGLEQFLSKDANRADLTRLMGPDAEVHFKEMHSMLNNAEFNRAGQSVLRNTIDEASKMMGKGMFTGGLLGSLGGHWHLGAAVGLGAGAANFTARQAMRIAMNDSQIGKLGSYAAKNDVSPKTY